MIKTENKTSFGNIVRDASADHKLRSITEKYLGLFPLCFGGWIWLLKIVLVKEPFKILCKMYSVTFASAKFISSLPRLAGGGVTGCSYHWACSICAAFYADAHITPGC